MKKLKKLNLPASVSCLPLTDKEIKELNMKLSGIKAEQEVLIRSQRIDPIVMITPMDI